MSVFFKALRSCVLIVLIAAVMLSCISCTNRAEREYEEELSDLLYRRQKLNNEKERILLSTENRLPKPACMSLLFVELDSALYTEAFPIMSRENENDVSIVGVMALSEGEIPGLAGKITREQYGTLIEIGWGNALYWSGEGELSTFITNMQALLEPLDIDLPTTVVFAQGTYDAAHDAVLSEYGIENAVHSGEGGLAYVESGEPDGVWHPGRIGWRCLGTSTRLKDTVESDGGYSIFEIGFDNSADKYETTFFPVVGDDSDADRVDKFYNMIASFKKSVINGKMTVDSVDRVRDIVENYHVAREMAELENAARLFEIEEELKAVNDEITQLYNRYH